MSIAALKNTSTMYIDNYYDMRNTVNLIHGIHMSRGFGGVEIGGRGEKAVLKRNGRTIPVLHIYA
jgi:hypothetical protein